MSKKLFKENWVMFIVCFAIATLCLHYMVKALDDSVVTICTDTLTGKLIEVREGEDIISDFKDCKKYETSEEIRSS